MEYYFPLTAHSMRLIMRYALVPGYWQLVCSSLIVLLLYILFSKTDTDDSLISSHLSSCSLVDDHVSQVYVKTDRKELE